MTENRGRVALIRIVAGIYALYALNKIFYQVVYFSQDCDPCSQTERLLDIHLLTVTILFLVGATGLFMLRKWGLLLTQMNLFYGLFSVWIFDANYYMNNYSLTVITSATVIVLLIIIWLNTNSFIALFNIRTRSKLLLGSVIGSIVLLLPLILL